MTWRRSALRWLPTFLGFPLGGFAAELIAGPVDGVAPAIVAGAVTGVILGAVQSWAIGPNGPRARQWLAATTAGLTLGLAVGSAAVGYDTDLADLLVQGAICGLIIGIAQAIVLRGRVAYLWAPALSALWALGWAVTTAIGVDVETQYAVFGSSGALVVTVATATLPALLSTRAPRSAA
jgi:hypothetical protein